MAEGGNEVKITTLKIDAKADVRSAINGLDKLTAKFTALQKAADAGFNFNGTVKVKALAEALAKLGDAGKIGIPKNLAERIVELGNAAECLKGVDFSKVHELADAYGKLKGLSDISLPKITGGNLGKAIDKLTAKTATSDLEGTTRQESQETQATKENTDATKENADAKVIAAERIAMLKLSIEGLTSTYKKLGSAMLTVGKGVGKVGLSISTLPFRYIGGKIAETVKGLKGFLAGIKRIALYRAIRTALKEITQGFKEGMDNLYQYSKAIDGQFAKSMDMLATSALYAKNSLGAMVAPIVNKLAPVIDMIVDKFVDFLNVVNETIASLTGAETWTRALKYPKEYAESADDATAAVKKLKATILGFDEINPLNDNSDNGRSSSGNSLDYSAMFTEEQVSTAAGNWVKKFKEAWENADFTDIGAALGTELKQQLDSIPWDNIKNSVDRVAQSIGTLINGFVEVEGLGTSIGTTIAEGMNTATGAVERFIDSTHWDSIGKFGGDIVNGITRTFDSQALGRTMAKSINSATMMLHNFINEVEWSRVGKFISDGIDSFFDEINTKELGETISDGILGAIDAINTILTETDFDKLGTKIGELIKGIDWQLVLGGLTAILLNALKAVFISLSSAIAAEPSLAGIIGGAIALKIGLGVIAKKAIMANSVGSAISGLSEEAAVTSACNGLGMSLGTVFGIAFAAAAGIYIGAKLGKWMADHIDDISETANKGVSKFENILYEHGILKDLSTSTQKRNGDEYWKSLRDRDKSEDRLVSGSLSGAKSFDTGKGSSKAEEIYDQFGSMSGVSNIEFKISPVIEKGSFVKLAAMKADVDYLYNDGKARTSTVKAETKNVGLFDTFYDWIANKIPALKTSTAMANTPNVYLWDVFRQKLYASKDRTVTETANTENMSLFDIFRDKLFASYNRTVTATAEVENLSVFDNLNKAVSDLPTTKTVDLVVNIASKLTDITSNITGSIATVGAGVAATLKNLFHFAEGGTALAGQLFIARESGPELIANVGNRTQIANNEQIVQGIADGVEAANMPQLALLREQNELLKRLLAKESNVTVSTDSLVNGLNRKNRRDGKTVVPVGM